jgi:hypothetical protein
MAANQEEGILDPWVVEWLETHPEPLRVSEGFSTAPMGLRPG